MRTLEEERAALVERIEAELRTWEGTRDYKWTALLRDCARALAAPPAAGIDVDAFLGALHASIFDPEAGYGTSDPRVWWPRLDAFCRTFFGRHAAPPAPDPQHEGLEPSAALASVSVCNCGADTFNRIRTDGGVVPHAPKCAALAFHPPERAGEPTDTERLDWLAGLGPFESTPAFWGRDGDLMELRVERCTDDQKHADLRAAIDAARKAAGEGKS